MEPLCSSCNRYFVSIAQIPGEDGIVTSVQEATVFEFQDLSSKGGFYVFIRRFIRRKPLWEFCGVYQLRHSSKMQYSKLPGFSIEQLTTTEDVQRTWMTAVDSNWPWTTVNRVRPDGLEARERELKEIFEVHGFWGMHLKWVREDPELLQKLRQQRI